MYDSMNQHQNTAMKHEIIQLSLVLYPHGIYWVVLSISRYGWFLDTQFCRTLEWFSNVWICKHTCPITRHRDPESKVKKSCADFDSRILTSYRYIPVYTEYNLVYTMRIQNQGQLSYFVLHGSVLLLDHAIIHPPWKVLRYSADCSQKWKKHVCRQ